MSFSEQSPPVLSIVTPAYNESENLPVLYERLIAVLQPLNVTWEWVIVDDHSRDNTFEVISRLAEKDPRVFGIRLARNSGSHTATPCAMAHTRGSCALLIAADLQDPPETLPALLEKWSQGAQIVWAVRRTRAEEDKSTIGFSRMYYWLMRRFVGVQMPKEGSDFVLMDRVVLDTFAQFGETNMSVLALLAWMGYRQDYIYYDRKARLHGTSGWNLEKKLKLLVDSITAFTYLPIRTMSYVGVLIAFCGFVYASLIVISALRGGLIPGWASLIVVVLVLGGVQMVMMGVLGEYLWRALDEARRRPRYLIEATTRSEHPAKSLTALNG